MRRSRGPWIIRARACDPSRTPRKGAEPQHERERRRIGRRPMRCEADGPTDVPAAAPAGDGCEGNGTAHRDVDHELRSGRAVAGSGVISITATFSARTASPPPPNRTPAD